MATSIKCQGPDCDVVFEARRTAKFCSATCRSRARRQRDAVSAEVESEKDAGAKAEHSLVRAVRRDLEKAKALDTVPGQLALQFAKRLVNPDESGLSAMSKELRALLAEAKADAADGAPAPTGSAPDAEDDEVKKARLRREEMAARAAAEAAEAEA